MSSGKSIIIVGSGIIGLSTAYYALLAGHRVTILERGGADHQGCSLGNAGMVVPSHFTPLAAPGMVSLGLRMLLNPESPFSIRPRLDADLIRWGWEFWRACTKEHVTKSAPLLRDLNLASRHAYEELSDQIGDYGLVKRGLLMLCQTPEALKEEAHVAEEAQKLGLNAHLLTPEEAAKLDPSIRMEIAGAIHFVEDCHLSPQRLMAGMAKAIEGVGGKILWNTEVVDWRQASGRIQSVVTKNGSFEGDEFVIAGGAWSPTLVRSLGITLPMQAGKGYSMTLPRPRQLPNLCSILTEARVAVTPIGESLRFAGTMEVTGLDTSVNQARVNGIRKAIVRYFPDFKLSDFEGLPVWSGLRPCSPDGLPYIGRFRQFSNLSTAAGHSMMGVSLGPVTGQLMSQILSNGQPQIEISALSPDRYA